jgi:catechol 2,3-dioxygenase-like lactoylglutathione lyase family enzyme
MTANSVVPPGSVVLSGVHHVRLAVANLERSFVWYRDLLGYRRDFDFRDGARTSGWALLHDAGGPPLALMHDPELARRAPDFTYFNFGMPTEASVYLLAKRFDAAGVRHGGVHQALAGAKLTQVEDPDGYRIGFYVVGKRDRSPPPLGN